MSQPYVKWADEDAPDQAGGHARAAWLVRDVADRFGETQEVLAYLGPRPAITPSLEEELEALYPAVAFDFAALRSTLEAPRTTDVSALTDDELALRLRTLAQERGLSPLELALRLGYTQRQILPELLALLEREGTAARLERTSGSIFEYLMESHLDYAFLIYKARLFFQGDDDTLDATIRDEPRGFSDKAWQERRAFWRERLDRHRARATSD